MQLIEEIMEKIEAGGHAKYARLMAEALYSACARDVAGPNMLALSSNLDSDNKALVVRLVNITREPDYSNAAQFAAARSLSQRYGLGTPDYKYV